MNDTGRAGRRRNKEQGKLKGAAGEARRALYHCNYCSKDISFVPRIKCAICKDFDLCLECFSVGMEITPHKNTHDYQVVENLSFPIYHPDWGADEEMLLLEGIDMFGLGNWGAVADHVGGKTAEQCRDHYFEVYIDVDTCPLPTPTREMALISQQEYIDCARQGLPRKRWRADSVAPDAPPSAAQGIRRVGSVATAGTTDGAGMASDVDASALPSTSEGAAAPAGDEEGEQTESQRQAAGHKGLKRPRGDTAGGAAPAGGTAVAGSQQQPGDPHVQTGERSVHHEPAGTSGDAAGKAGPAAVARPADVPAGAAGVGSSGMSKSKPQGPVDQTGFNIKRDEFDPEYDNDAESVIADMEFTDQDTEADIAIKVKMLQIYNKRLDERERRRAFVLQTGLLNTKAAQVLERRRTTQERDVHASLRVFARYAPTPAAHEELVEGLLLEARMRSRIAELQAYRRNGVRTFQAADVFDVERRRQKAGSEAAAAAAPGQSTFRTATLLPQAYKAKAIAGADLGLGSDPASSSAAGIGTAAAMAGAGGGSSGLPAHPCGPTGGLQMGRGAGAALTTWRQRRGVPLDVTCLPGVELLSSKERELCASIRLLPPHYLALKEMYLREEAQHGPLTRQEARTFFRLEPPRAARIFDLQVQSGWMTDNTKSTKAVKAGAEGGGEDGDADALLVDGMDEGTPGPQGMGAGGEDGEGEEVKGLLLGGGMGLVPLPPMLGQ